MLKNVPKTKWLNNGFIQDNQIVIAEKLKQNNGFGNINLRELANN